ncbi:MAG: hypothetical protein LE168_00305 [Endomicrobium sp.]|nr:hypothetical protein [Endomicrobium sp.]
MMHGGSITNQELRERAVKALKDRQTLADFNYGYDRYAEPLAYLTDGAVIALLNSFGVPSSLIRIQKTIGDHKDTLKGSQQEFNTVAAELGLYKLAISPGNLEDVYNEAYAYEVAHGIEHFDNIVKNLVAIAVQYRHAKFSEKEIRRRLEEDFPRFEELRQRKAAANKAMCDENNLSEKDFKEREELFITQINEAAND